MTFRVWMRAVRVRFLLSSAISVALGGAVSWQVDGTVNPADVLLIAAGVLALHASVDLLNDYRDYKRGIDRDAPRTKMSGGTGVLPEGLLRPESVNRAGLLCLFVGASIGAYYIYLHGMIVGIILGFAVVSIYFYSTRIVDWGLGELFVGVKGALIVLGTYYIQAGHLGPEAALAGAAAGSLSALVLFIASFPDHDADKSGGRRTLVIRCGPRRAARLYWAFPGVFAGIVLSGVYQGYFPLHSLSSLLALPLAVSAGMGLSRNPRDAGALYPHMHRTLLYSRAAGTLLVAGFLAAGVISAISGAA